MSKSLGNTVDPLDIVKEYGADALRYYVARELSPFEDSPFTSEKFKEGYNAGLANGIGNLTSRIMKMATTYGVTYNDYVGEKEDALYSFNYEKNYDSFNIHQEADAIWKDIAALDTYIQREEPFKKIKTNEVEGKKDVAYLLSHLLRVAIRMTPILPNTSEVIQSLIKENKMPETPLFMRK